MQYRVVNTDNFGGDYPNERFVGSFYETKELAQAAADQLNGPDPENDCATRYHKVVDESYVLQPGFEP